MKRYAVIVNNYSNERFEVIDKVAEMDIYVYFKKQGCVLYESDDRDACIKKAEHFKIEPKFFRFFSLN